MSSTRRRLLAALVVALVAASCGGGDDDGVATETTASTTTTTAAPTTTTTTSTTTTTIATTTTEVDLGPLYPLTGEPIGDAEAPTGPALVMKVSNNNADSRRALIGLDHADIIYEERIESDATRFAAVFHSDVPEEIGPVRSARHRRQPEQPHLRVFGLESGCRVATAHGRWPRVAPAGHRRNRSLTLLS